MLVPTIITLCILPQVLLSTKGDNLDEYELQKSVVIVGGGIAGLAAARTLQNTGKFSVSILEARRDRYGGRIHTDRKAMKSAKGVEVDLGAIWLNSMLKDNPLAKLAVDEELEVKSTGKVQLHFPEKDKVFTGDEANQVFTELYQVTLDAMETVTKRGKDMELMSAMKKSLEKAETTSDKSLLASILSSHYTMSLPNHSTSHFLPRKEFGWDTAIVDGFDQITDILVGGRRKESTLMVELRKPVRQISVDRKKNKVLVRTRDLKQFEADAVVVALPVGVMKSDIVLFDPPLPKSFRKALESLGHGNANKVILQFNKVFWPEDVGVFTMVSSNHDDNGMMQTWVNLHRFVQKPMLMGDLHGEAAVRFENMTDDSIKMNAIQVLTKMFGEDKLKDVSVSIVTKSTWASDNNLRGSITYPKVGTNADVFQSLSEPVCPFIYFAGEYTSLEHMNTAHGAYLSGVTAATQIINNYCDDKKKKEEEKREKQQAEKLNDSSSAKKTDKLESKDEL